MASLALAQVLPPGIDPGRVPERIEPPRAPRPAELPELKGRERELPEAVKAVRVTLKAVRIEGAAALPAQRLQPLADRYVGREIGGGEIFDLARALTAEYRNAGYILSQVIVPPQSLAGGVLVLRVVEGYIADVRVEGETAARETLLALGEKIKASRPLRAGDLERYLLIANDLAGVRLRSVLVPSQAAGAADLVLIAAEKRVEGFASLDNYGSKYLGPIQLSGGLAVNRLFGDDQLRLTGAAAGDSEMGYAELAYSRFLGSEGLKLGASASQTRTRPGDILEPFEVRGRADVALLSLEYPFLRTRNASLLGRSVLDYRDIDTDILGTRIIEDRIRALRLGLTWLGLDRLNGSNVLDVELGLGLGGTGPGDLLKSRAGADGEFRKITFDYQRLQPIGASYVVTFGLGGQWTDEPLLSSEQFALGGRRFGRAYEPAELAGDRALAFRIEPAYLGRPAGWLRSYQLYGFYDGGKVWYRDDPATGERPGESLASAGFGARAFLGADVSATLEVAWPLTRPIASYRDDGDDPRILGSMVIRF